MYLKCYHNKQKQIATVEEVLAVLPDDMPELEVDDNLGYPSWYPLYRPATSSEVVAGSGI